MGLILRRLGVENEEMLPFFTELESTHQLLGLYSNYTKTSLPDGDEPIQATAGEDAESVDAV